ncbi:cupin superfamily protein [Lophiotrema nucula]|uniref:Cupin superfamily protein n=1 Tax=Lophiotrema nucula TaxID=690887 RepID=A0A6A5YM74_9PLEO|nr:cupin superfamily protein [Lophiotrema nucula]
MLILLIGGLLALLAHGIAAAPHKPGKGPLHSAQEVIQKLNLTANPEKGYYIQTYEDPGEYNGRSYSTAIYYLLEGRVGASYWHKVDATEVWHHYAGSPLRLDLSWNNGTSTQHRVLGDDIFSAQRPQVVIEKQLWQRAQSLGEWTLVGTTVAPGFSEAGYEIASPDWEPNDGIDG